MNQRIIGRIALVGLWAVGCNGRSTTQSVGTESHFLMDCQTEAACGPGLSCLAGRCTKTCELDADCASLSSASSCMADADSAGSSCDLACNTEADCDSVESASCANNQCRVTAQGTAGGAGAGGSGSSGSAAGGTINAGGSGGTSSNGGAGPCECGPPPPLPLRMCDDGTFVGTASCVDNEDGSCGWRQGDCPLSAEGGASSGGAAQGGSEAQGGASSGGSETQGGASGGSEAQGGASNGGASATSASQLLEDCDIPVVGEPMVQEIAVPAELTGPNWGIKADACEQGGWDLSLCAGASATFTSFDAAEPGEPTTIWVATLDGEVCCVYGSGTANPGIYNVSCN